MSSVETCINYFYRNKYPNLFDAECYQRLQNVFNQFGNLATHETILEVVLSNNEKSCDYSIRLDGDDLTKEYWLELDFEACRENPIQPCYFIDATNIKSAADIEETCAKILPKIAPVETIQAVRQNLQKVFELFKDVGFYQIGSMSSRKPSNSLRIFLNDASRSFIIENLSKIWRGDLLVLENLLTKFEKYSDGRKFIIDFDIFADSISEKIGVNFGTVNKTTSTIKKFLEFLRTENLCTVEKMHDVLKFIDEFPQYSPYVQNDISHFKFAFESGKVSKAKAYLRQGDDFYRHDFRAYSAPIIMNLELTTKCPLNCPQCYCDLAGGQNMDKETALYWISQAAKSGVKFVNLSGGETFCYPYLLELVEECKRLNLEANVAFSGYKCSEENLRELIKKGVADICISLNGSTKEINDLSRDGYDLAISALENLKNLNYNRTLINWVMHSFNADDFDNILTLAENFNVKAVAVMMFKPDKNSQMPSIPTRQQILDIAKKIKAYKGKVKIEIEECFSQLRAVVGERFFVNYNSGISRGCGAGRDGISVSVDGFLTPCRHLFTLKEKFATIDEYWNNSKILQNLRTTEDHLENPCAACRYKLYCLPCMAVVLNFKNDFVMCDEHCPLAQVF